MLMSDCKRLCPSSLWHYLPCHLYTPMSSVHCTASAYWLSRLLKCPLHPSDQVGELIMNISLVCTLFVCLLLIYFMIYWSGLMPWWPGSLMVLMCGVFSWGNINLWLLCRDSSWLACTLIQSPPHHHTCAVDVGKHKEFNERSQSSLVWSIAWH